MCLGSNFLPVLSGFFTQNSGVPPNHLDALLKYFLPGPTPRVYRAVGLGRELRFTGTAAVGSGTTLLRTIALQISNAQQLIPELPGSWILMYFAIKEGQRGPFLNSLLKRKF